MQEQVPATGLDALAVAAPRLRRELKVSSLRCRPPALRTLNPHLTNRGIRRSCSHGSRCRLFHADTSCCTGSTSCSKSYVTMASMASALRFLAWSGIQPVSLVPTAPVPAAWLGSTSQPPSRSLEPKQPQQSSFLDVTKIGNS